MLSSAGRRARDVNIRGKASLNSIHCTADRDGYGNDERCSPHPQDVALVACLKTCADSKNLSKGARLHAEILRQGSLQNNVFISSTLVNLYAKCGALAKAQQLLDELPSHIVSWNSLIAGFAQQERGKNALDCFQRMQCLGIPPDPVTYACILKSCSSTRAVEKGRELHADLVRKGFLQTNTILWNALVDMYAKCGVMAKAQQVFWDIPAKNIISWTTLIAGYCQHDHGEAALYFLDQMQQEGLSPNPMTFSCALKACASIGAFRKGKELHEEIISQGLLGKDIVLGNALMLMYIKCGALVRAQEVFDELSFRNVVSWTCLITGYCAHGYAKQAILNFERMKKDGLCPNAVTFSCIVKACSIIGATDKGEEIFAEIARMRFWGKNTWPL